MKLRPNTVMPGGWHFVDSDGTRIEAPLAASLYEAIADHRIRRGVPVGDVVREVHEYVCGKWPGHCDKEAKDYGIDDSIPGITDIFNRLTIWVANMVQRLPQGGYPVVAESKATARMNTCVGCPRSVIWGCGCGSDSRVEVALNRLSFPRSTSPAKIVNRACLSSGWGCSVACNLSLADLSATPESLAAAQMPAHCWAVQESMPA